MKPWRRRLRMATGLGFALLLMIQLVPYGHGHVNSPVTAEPAWDSPDTRALAKQACFDCHSNETAWPLYAKAAPISWMIQRHVDKGRAVLNFSEWRRPQKEAHEAAEEVLEGHMPPRTYRLMHAHARLTAVDRETLARGLDLTLRRPAPSAGAR